MRLQKYIALCGACSRREAENWISAGRVTLNGRVAALGESTESADDVVCVDGVPLRPPGEHTYVMLHKPRGCVTTMRDEKDRPTAASLVAEAGGRLFPVGRLDMQSEGLLLFTDDGELANRLAHPSHGVKKTYRVWVQGESVAEKAAALGEPITWEGVRYRGAKVRIISQNDNTGILELTISEGKNREIRNMCAAVGLRVKRLLRLRQGPLSLGDLPAGQWRHLTEEEVAALRRLS